jgi:hypothetical protein
MQLMHGKKAMLKYISQWIQLLTINLINKFKTNLEGNCLVAEMFWSFHFWDTHYSWSSFALFGSFDLYITLNSSLADRQTILSYGKWQYTPLHSNFKIIAPLRSRYKSLTTLLTYISQYLDILAGRFYWPEKDLGGRGRNLNLISILYQQAGISNA